MATPVVQSIDQILATLAPGSAPEKQLIGKQIAAAPARFAGQRAGLEAEKNKGFSTILQGATNRGVGFSGIPLAEQADFLSTSYLPAVANLQIQENDFTTSLQSALNQIGARDREQAFIERARQQERLDEFLARQEAAAAARRAAASGGGFPFPFSPGADDGQGGGDADRQRVIKDEQERQKAVTFAQSFVRSTKGGRSGIEIIRDLSKRAKAGDVVAGYRLAAIKKAMKNQTSTVQQTARKNTSNVRSSPGYQTRGGLSKALSILRGGRFF